MNPLRLAAIASTVALAAAEWAIKDAKLTVSSRGTELVSLPFTSEAVDAAVPPEASVDLVFFTTNGGKASVPHQSMVIIADSETGLEASYPVLVRPNGRAKFAIPHSRLPNALVAAQRPLDVKVVLGSFDTKGSETVVARISPELSEETKQYKKPERHATKPEIKHVFRPAARQVNASVATLFSAGAVAIFAVLLIAWSALIGPATLLGQASGALKAAPLGYLGLLGSLVAFELVFASYFIKTSIFTTLGAVSLITPVAVVSGVSALRELHERRITGQRE